MLVVDSHIHCGVQKVAHPFNRIKPLLEQAGIARACITSPVEDIYYRYSAAFDDNAAWQKCRTFSREYLLEIARANTGIYPFYFVWNDFKTDDLNKRYYGVKWHHHEGEPPYHYSDGRCAEMIDTICARNLPIILEETFDQTIKFLDMVNERSPVILPHLGLVNGGFERLYEERVWEANNVFANTALAGFREIKIYLETYGPDRLLFGSGYPFGLPGLLLDRLMDMRMGRKALKKICGENILRLIHATTR